MLHLFIRYREKFLSSDHSMLIISAIVEPLATFQKSLLLLEQWFHQFGYVYSVDAKTQSQIPPVARHYSASTSYSFNLCDSSAE
jgi:hypothetical protein